MDRKWLGIMRTDNNKYFPFTVYLQVDSDKDFDLVEKIAKVRSDYPIKPAKMTDKEYKEVVDTFFANEFDAKVSKNYSAKGELNFRDYTSARFCIRDLKKLLEVK